MGECKKGTHKNNDIVKFSAPLVCYGWDEGGEPPCEFLKDCANENGVRLRKKFLLKPTPHVGFEKVKNV